MRLLRVCFSNLRIVHLLPLREYVNPQTGWSQFLNIQLSSAELTIGACFSATANALASYSVTDNLGHTLSLLQNRHSSIDVSKFIYELQ
jgi:hypothetical protein